MGRDHLAGDIVKGAEGMASVPMLLAVVTDEGWRPGIGDPTVMGWVTVAAYLGAACGCAVAAWREAQPDGPRRDRPSRFWLLLAAILVALGINKQLDLQSLVTVVGRRVLKAQGQYEHRRVYQIAFIGAVAVACVCLLGVLLRATRRTMHRRWPAIAGMVFISGFVVIRASSFHHIDGFLSALPIGLKWNWILELGGVGTVGFAAFRSALAPPPRRHPPRREVRG